MSPHNSPSHGRRRADVRAGFTLIELLVVISVIAILVAMLIPAIGAIRARAAVAQVRVEISGLESDITAFQAEFGDAPPSGIILSEDGTGWTVAHQALIRRLWPQFNFALPRDINGNGTTTDTITLNGSQCLVFFLGGVTATNMVDKTGGNITGGTLPVNDWTPLGFSRNPRDPFERGGGTRTGPFHEFDRDRLRNSPFSGTDPAMPVYLDTLNSQTRPYVYISSYNGRGYSLPDLQGTTLTNVYLQKDSAAAIGDASEIPWKQKQFQIISPGFDTEYGIGGVYDPSGTLLPAQVRDRDNITNFSTGQLE